MQLESIKGIGPRTVNTLKRLGINDDYDLISYYPFRYTIIEKMDLIENEKAIIDGYVDSVPNLTYLRGHNDKMTFRLNTGSRLINVSIFNRGYLKNKLGIKTCVTVMGKYSKNMLIASDIRFSLLGDRKIIEPVYHVTTGINSNQLNNLIKLVDVNVNDYIPSYLNEKYNFDTKAKCIREIHNPVNLDNLKKTINKLKYEELFLFMLKMNYLKKQKKMKGLIRNVDKNKINEFINTLPFKLTTDQLKCVDEIYNDLTSERRMNRLLQGDVGSGKTIVSFIALLINYLSGYQGALMAPTEILALQHYNNIVSLFPSLNIALLTGKMRVKEKREIYSQLSDGTIDIVIGTHALISENVKYNNLGLVITDEQHRFGVNQRSCLKNKGLLPDVLYMSATPIPRTYAITLFGDMDISNIKTKPNGRKEIRTLIKNSSEIKDALTIMYDELKSNHQVYVVAPLIEESEKIELENINRLKDKMELAFGKHYKIGVMHGKLSSKEKDEIMNSFKSNEIQILISTTVIEVGVDVSNATVMVVFDSYRFGLSALHQLRGRIGRNELQSYFIMISDKECERLKILVKTNDGFLVSEADFKLRGSGDLFGIKQSGDMTFKLANIKKDYSLLLKARDDSEEFINKYLDNDKYKYISDIVKKLDSLD